MTGTLDQALHQERSELVLALSGNSVNADMGWQIIHRWDALVEVAKAAQDDSLADALAVIEHALGPNGSPIDALRHVQKVIVKHRLPIRATLARLEDNQ